MMDGIAQLKLLEALRAPDAAAFEHVRDVYNLEQSPNLLELAIGSAPPVLSSVLDYYRKAGRNINEQNTFGNTALHIAAANDALPQAKLLLKEPTINDAVQNTQGEFPIDMAKGPEMQRLLQQSQNAFLRDVSVELKSAFAARDLPTLKGIFANPRVQELVSLNGLDPDTGNSVLHDAAAAGDAPLVEFILQQKGDPLVRNLRKQAPIDVAKGEQVQKLLASAAKNQTVSSTPDKLEGFLKKWTNFTQGYRSRWFVLESGQLKYYKSPKDSIPRDTIHLNKASLKVQSSVNKGFELSSPERKLILRAAHPNEANRWVWALQNAITESKQPRKSQGSNVTQRSAAPSHLAVPAAGGAAAASTASLAHRRQHSTRSRFIDDLDGGSIGAASDDDFDEEEPLGAPPAPEGIIAALDGLAELTRQPKSEQADNTALATIEQLKNDVEAWKLYHLKASKRLQLQLEAADNQQRLWAQNCRALEIKLEKAEAMLYSKSDSTKSAEQEDDDDEFFDTVEEWEKANDQPSARSGAVAGAGAAGAAAVGGAAVASQETSDSKSEPKETKEPSEETKDSSKDSKDSTAHSQGKETPAQQKVESELEESHCFAGYENGFRSKLPLDIDDRPKISLWGVLKSLIGKDMTKMTLPVSFNECTNLLQRSAEDLEYVNLLDKAAEVTDDEGLRMAYVAAFAASSYSSTIGRVAKPFNPLLGETFEYCRPDGKFRMVAEQVSHHPPVGALMANSPHWDFYGHSHVKSKFYGRSFDIVPTGLWYIRLRPNDGAGVDEELYTFRKVTSSVVGIMVGNPIVDNYGPMVITNHTTGTTCELDFKARGWRGGSAYKVEGKVKDKDGKELWTVGGAWNDKIYAKSSSGDSKGRFLLWQAHDRPSGPFNLTPFAITLNDLPKGLEDWLPPTDTRFRPDQKDMEEGRYDAASESKNRVEEKQRAVRRQREAEGSAYVPKWFELAKHPVTGEDYYAPINDYWGHRAKHELKEGDIF